MNIAEYRTALEAKAIWIGPTTTIDPDLSRTGGEVTTHEVLLLVELPNGTYQHIVQGFHVLGEGAAEETVYPVAREAQNNPPNPFADQVRAYADTQINATRPKVVIDSVDEVNEFALVTAYELVADQITVVRYFVAKNDQGDAYIKEFVG